MLRRRRLLGRRRRRRRAERGEAARRGAGAGRREGPGGGGGGGRAAAATAARRRAASAASRARLSSAACRRRASSARARASSRALRARAASSASCSWRWRSSSFSAATSRSRVGGVGGGRAGCGGARPAAVVGSAAWPRPGVAAVWSAAAEPRFVPDTAAGAAGDAAAAVPAFSLPAATWSTLSTDARPCTLTVPSGVRIFIHPPPVFSSTTPTAPSCAPLRRRTVSPTARASAFWRGILARVTR